MNEATGQPALIDVKGLTKRYGDRVVVDHFDMRVPKGLKLEIVRHNLN